MSHPKTETNQFADHAPRSAPGEAHDPFSQGVIVRAVPTTESQRELWLSVRIGGDAANCAYNESLHLELTGSLDVGALEQALVTAAERHEALRAIISPDGQSLCILEWVPLPLRLVDLSAHADEARSRGVRDLVADEVRHAFDLENGPLCRATLVRLEWDRHVFVFTAHHIVCDGWSAAVLMSELGAAYTASVGQVEVTLDAAPSFADYALAECSAEYRAANETAQAYWLSRFANEPPQTEFPIEGRRPPSRTFEAARIDWDLDVQVLAALRALGAQHKSTFVATLFSAFTLYLGRLTGKADLVVGMPSAGQAATGDLGLVGHCANTLPIRVQIDLEQPFARHLSIARNALLEAQEHREFGFGALVQRLRIARDTSRLPLASVLFNVDTAISCDYFSGLEARLTSNPRAFENFEFSLNAVDYGTSLTFEATYNTNLFTREQIERRMAGLCALIADLVARPDEALGRLDILSPTERGQVVEEFNATFAGNAELPSVPRMFEERARAHPDHVAISAEDRSLTYRELEARSNQVARWLVSRGVTPGARIAVCLTRRADLPVALLGILKAGAAYVPVDPAYPKQRIAMILEDAGPQLVLVEKATQSSIPQLVAVPVVDIDDPTAAIASAETTALELAIEGDALAYVIFTSGSTGRPKGVQIPHRAFSNFLRSMAKTPGFEPGQRLLAVTTVSFDIAGLELFLPLIAGGSVKLLRQETTLDAFALRRVLESERIDLLQATPATFRMLLDADFRGGPHLKLLCGGEAFPVDLAAALIPRSGGLYNMYGPTETTVWSTLHRVESATGLSIPIGRPIDGTRVYVLDERLAPLPMGVEGDLYIGGVGLALGYHNRPELTEAAFLADPFVPGERIYRTGDRARWLSDGTLDHRGRRDSQVKVRGFRIELGEIEAALTDIEGVREVAVLVREDFLNDKRLVAYLVGAPFLDVASLRQKLHERLPRYMIPSSFVFLDGMPLTAGRKIDRRALPPPTEADTHATAAIEQAENDDEAAIAAMFSDLLRIGEVGRSADFFELGGHSLLAIQLANQLGAFFGVEFSVATVFKGATVRALAKAGRERTSRESGERSALVRLCRGTPHVKLFFVCGVNIYAKLAREIGDPYDVYGVFDAYELKYLENNDGGEVSKDFTAEEIARRYTKLIRQEQPHGPYCLAGVSFGGILAYEIAQQLRLVGEEVAFLGLLDPILPRAVSSHPMQFFTHHVRRVVDMRPGDRRAYLESLARHVLRRPGEKSDQGSSAPSMMELRENAYEVAIARYDATVRPYSGDAVLFRATDHSEYVRHRVERDCGWAGLVENLEIVDVPGDHLGILRDRSARLVAGVIREKLSALERPPASVGRRSAAPSQ